MSKSKKSTYQSGWWFGTCFMFPYIGNSNPNYYSLIFFRGVGLKPPCFPCFRAACLLREGSEALVSRFPNFIYKAILLLLAANGNAARLPAALVHGAPRRPSSHRSTSRNAWSLQGTEMDGTYVWIAVECGLHC